MEFNNNYKELYKITKKLEKNEEKLKKLREWYDEECSYLREDSSISHLEYNKRMMKLYSEFKKKEKLLEQEKEYLIIERDYAGFNKSLFIRVGDLREEVAKSLGIDPSEVRLYSQIASSDAWIANHTMGDYSISESSYDILKEENEKEYINILIRVYPDSSKNLDYDIVESFTFKSDYNMPQADGISLLDHLYKRVEEPHYEVYYDEKKLKDDEVEDLYLKVPYKLLFHKEADTEFESGSIDMNPEAYLRFRAFGLQSDLDDQEMFHYEIHEYRVKDKKRVQPLNVFRRCMINYLKKEDIKNKSLIKKK